MTKVRAPLSIENTLYEVLGRVGIERAGEITGRTAGYLRALSDPDKREKLTVEDAIKLDLEHHAAGGDGHPFFETIGLLLEAARAERFADAATLGRHAISVAKESGEATAALIAAALSNGSPAALETALRELEQDQAAGAAAIVDLRNALNRARDGPSLHPG